MVKVTLFYVTLVDCHAAKGAFLSQFRELGELSAIVCGRTEWKCRPTRISCILGGRHCARFCVRYAAISLSA